MNFLLASFCFQMDIMNQLELFLCEMFDRRKCLSSNRDHRHITSLSQTYDLQQVGFDPDQD